MITSFKYNIHIAGKVSTPPAVFALFAKTEYYYEDLNKRHKYIFLC